MSTLRELITKLDETLDRAKVELSEFEKGRKVAAPELRKLAQTSKVIWQEFRGVVMEELKAMPTKKREK